MGEHLSSTASLLAVALVLTAALVLFSPTAAAGGGGGVATVNYGDVHLSGGFMAGHFSDVWDLTKSDLVISLTYDANGLVDDYGSAAHAWAELGVRTVGYGDFNPTWQAEGAGVWLATDYDWSPNTFDPDPPRYSGLDLDDKLILQKGGGWGEGSYDLPSTPPNPGANHGIWFDRDSVDQWQAQMWGCKDRRTWNTEGKYDVVITLHATSPTTATAYMTVNGEQQGFYNSWTNGPPDLYPAGMTFTGDMARLQVFYGIYGYGAAHSVAFEDIVVTGIVTGPRTTKNGAIVELEAALTGDAKMDKKIDQIIKAIEKSLKEELWLGEDNLNPKHFQKVFDAEKEAVKLIGELLKREDLPAGLRTALEKVVLKLVSADRILAKTELGLARVIPDPDDKARREIGKAEEELGKAGTEEAQGDYDKAIDHYKSVWEHAWHAIERS